MNTTIFLSTVTNEFGELRERRAKGLLRAGYSVEVQHDFPQSASDTLRKLNDLVQPCAALVHIIGAQPGSTCAERALTDFRKNCTVATGFLRQLPDLKTALGDLSDLTYTQAEAFLALHHGVPLFVYTDRDPKDKNHPQRRHLDRLAIDGRYAEPFDSEADLADKIQADLRRHFGDVPDRRPLNLPASIGRLFKGRGPFLDDLRAGLIDRGAAAVIATQAVHGLGGIGKTRLAIEYGHRYSGEYNALLFLRADSPENLQRNLAELTGPLILDLPEYTAPDLDTRVAAALNWLDDHPGWFLILDNVDDEPAAAAVEQLLGRLSRGHVVITSRLGDFSAQIEPLNLDVLSEDDAVEFLLERTGRTRGLEGIAPSMPRSPSARSSAEPTERFPPSDAEAARLLAQELDGLALALEQAGAYIRAKRISIEAYRQRLETRKPEVLSWFDERRMQYPASVAQTWESSFAELSPAAQQLLDALAFLAPDPIPREMVEGTVDGGTVDSGSEGDSADDHHSPQSTIHNPPPRRSRAA